MVSDSVASSVGQTGRPSMWDGSGQRKLARLYTYTRLSMDQMQKVLTAMVFRETTACPGEDSVHKKLSQNLDKEPRWLRPKTDTDMSRRFAGLASSPTRSHAPDNPLQHGHSRAASSSVSSHHTLDQMMVKDEPPVTPNMNELYLSEGPTTMYWKQSTTPVPMPLPAVITPSVAFAAWESNESAGYGLGISSVSAKGLLRQSTIMSTSTDMTTNTIQQAIPECPEGIIRKVSKLMKRYTIPNPPMAPDTPENSESVSPGGTEHSWTYDEDEELLANDNRPLPGDFLRMDHEIRGDARCHSTESPEHQSRSCYCDASAAATVTRAASTQASATHWVSEAGVTHGVQCIIENGLATAPDRNARDAYGNTLLHLMAARDVPHQALVRALDDATNPSATNSADQTFLHLLSLSWFNSPTSLINLLHKLDRDGFDIYAPDAYGKTIFHILEDRLEEGDARLALDTILRPFQRDLYHRRDACGILPGHAQPPSRPVLQLDTSFLAPDQQGSTPIVGNGNYSKQARLLQFISASHIDPMQEDDQGRNSLHCLAAVILSEDTLRAQYPEDHTPPTPDSPTNARKRKFHTPYIQKKASDSSKGRLSFRLELLQTLLAAGADPNHYAKDGTTPLMAFIRHLPEDGDYKIPPSILLTLLNGGARINARNRKGETALHVAVRCGRKLAVRMLVQNGANVHARDSAGRSVLDVLDVKYSRTQRDHKANAHYEACRAWLTGSEGKAVQDPSVTQEWGWRDA